MGAEPPRSGTPTRGTWVVRTVLLVVTACVLAVACAPRTTTVAVDEARATPRRSAGCGGAPARAAPDRLVVGGVERTILARVPAGPATGPRDLVLAFHGRTNDAARFRSYAGLDDALPDAIVVYPRALAAGPGAFAWAAPGDPPDAPRDAALVAALIDAFGAAHCLDLDRVFVVGHSLGAYFANGVACRMGDRIRAVASVAGGLQGDACAGGAAAMLVHHRDDRLVPMGEGIAARDAFRSANGLGAGSARAIAEGPLARLRCERTGSAGAGAPVVWCPRDDATTPPGLDPHTWPVGAAAAIAAFFADLP